MRVEALLKQKIVRFLFTAPLWFAVSLWFCGGPVVKAFAFAGLEENQLIRVKVHGLTVEPLSDQHVVILSDYSEERGLPIIVDPFVANAIHSALQGIAHRRPLTHDLLERIIKKANLQIGRTVITHLSEGIYYATIQMEREGSHIEIDARPSDSIVVALKFRVPIFVSETLFLDKAIPFSPKKIEDDYGVKFQDLTPSLAQAFSFDATHGILVSDVRKGSRAEKDGIERGDIFVEVGGQAVENVMSMRDALERSKTAVEARIFRKGQFHSITVNAY